MVGYRSREAGGALRMNPPDDDTLGDGDAVIALAETGAVWHAARPLDTVSANVAWA